MALLDSLVCAENVRHSCQLILDGLVRTTRRDARTMDQIRGWLTGMQGHHEITMCRRDKVWPSSSRSTPLKPTVEPYLPARATWYKPWTR